MAAIAWEEKGEGLKREHWSRKMFHFEEWGVALCKLHYKVAFKIAGALTFFLGKFLVSNVVCGIIVSSVKRPCCSTQQQQQNSFTFLSYQFCNWSRKGRYQICIVSLIASGNELCATLCVEMHMPLTFQPVGWFQLNLIERQTFQRKLNSHNLCGSRQIEVKDIFQSPSWKVAVWQFVVEWENSKQAESLYITQPQKNLQLDLSPQ